MNLVRAKMDLEPRVRPTSWITCASWPSRPLAKADDASCQRRR